MVAVVPSGDSFTARVVGAVKLTIASSVPIRWYTIVRHDSASASSLTVELR
jgi:hypothetical protein